MVWDYEITGGAAFVGIVWRHRDADGIIKMVLNVDAAGDVTPQPGFSHASFTPPATLNLDPLAASDDGEIICDVYADDSTKADDSIFLTFVDENGEFL